MRVRVCVTLSLAIRPHAQREPPRAATGDCGGRSPQREGRQASGSPRTGPQGREEGTTVSALELLPGEAAGHASRSAQPMGTNHGQHSTATGHDLPVPRNRPPVLRRRGRSSTLLDIPALGRTALQAAMADDKVTSPPPCVPRVPPATSQHWAWPVPGSQLSCPTPTPGWYKPPLPTPGQAALTRRSAGVGGCEPHSGFEPEGNCRAPSEAHRRVPAERGEASPREADSPRDSKGPCEDSCALFQSIKRAPLAPGDSAPVLYVSRCP